MIRTLLPPWGKTGIVIIGLLLVLAAVSLPAAASDTPTALGVFPAKSDVANLAFANQPAGYYYFKFNQVGGGGINALHISSNSADLPNYGDVSTTASGSGTFYITDTGGRGYQDEAILLVAVMGEIPDNFAIHLRSSGYSWAPTGSKDTPPTLSQITYRAGAIDQTFTKAQFVYGPQSWKPAGNNVPSDYPLYYGQDTGDTTRLFKLMFVDLKAGPLGPNSKVDRPDAIDVAALTDQGAIKVDYSVENLDTVVTFNVYAWNDNTTQGHGISWSNGLTSGGSVPSAVSGYTVLGSEYKDRASEFPTIGSQTPIYHSATINFTANVTAGEAPLAIQFTDTTTQTIKNWFWDFGDGTTSAEQNPLHIYKSSGSYTVSLSAENNQNIASLKTVPAYITVNGSSGGGTSPGGPGGYDSGTNGETWESFLANSTRTNRVVFSSNISTGTPPLAVRFTDNSSIPYASGWAWDFTGDAVPDSNEQNPTYVFNKIGNYSLNLTVTTSAGRAYTRSVPDYIQVTELPVVAGETWVSSDQYDTGQGSEGSARPHVSPQATATPSPSTRNAGGYTPFGTKVAEILLDVIIVGGVIGTGIILWKRK